MVLTDGINRQQQDLMDYIQEEVRVLRELQGRSV
jgi:hypothetical protein